jgi:hypothetical protein
MIASDAAPIVREVTDEQEPFVPTAPENYPMRADAPTVSAAEMIEAVRVFKLRAAAVLRSPSKPVAARRPIRCRARSGRRATSRRARTTSAVRGRPRRRSSLRDDDGRGATRPTVLASGVEPPGHAPGD